MSQTATVIISTYNGAEKLPFLLEALTVQTFQDFELVVVIDGSTDNTIEVLHKFAERFKSFRIIQQPNGGRSKVKNRGVAEAHADLLIFYDDDMVPSVNSVERHVELHKKEKWVIAGNPVEKAEGDKTDVQNYKAMLSKRWTEKYKEPVNILSLGNLFFTAANCSVSKKAFEELGGFDERLTDAEDFNFAYRAVQAGMKVAFDKKNIAVHREFVSAKKYAHRLREYRAAHQRVKSFYPEVHFSDGKSTVFYKRWIYGMFANTVWLSRIDNESLTFLPRKIRYKLYDMIFHSLSVEYPEVKI